MSFSIADWHQALPSSTKFKRWIQRPGCIHSWLERERESRSVMSDSLWPHGLYSPYDSPGQNSGVGSLKPSLIWKSYRKSVCDHLAARCSKANKQPRLVERKVCFISDAGNWGQGRADVCPKADSQLPPVTSWARGFIDRRRGLHAGTGQSAVTVIFKLVTGGLTCIILVVLGTVNL